jgi:hypothetical protein
VHALIAASLNAALVFIAFAHTRQQTATARYIRTVDEILR